MKGRDSKGAPNSTDLLVCFPSGAHLTLMPKPICSPARHSSELTKRRSKSRLLLHSSHLRKSSGHGQGSPILWNKTKSMDTEITEPTSPKVTCAGQIKVRPKTSSRRSWQSVMEEIEKIHNDRKLRKRSNWVESLDFKKEIVQFLTCLRNIRFDFRCFGSFPEDEEEAEGYPENHVAIEGRESESSKTVFSKWFMVLQEEQNCNRFCKDDRKEKGKLFDEGSNEHEPTVPPPNALLLVRCRSAPAKSWLQQKEQEEEDRESDEQEEKAENNSREQQGAGKEEGSSMAVQRGRSLRSLMDEEKRNKEKENMVVMKYEPDIYAITSDIAKETWLVGGLRESLSKSRSWKR